MIDFIARRYFRQRPVIRHYVLAVTTTPQLLMAADPTRFACSLVSNANGNCNYHFGPETPTASDFQYPTAAGPWWLTEDDVGGLIQYPLWLWAGSGSFTAGVVACSYDPTLLSEMDAYVRRYVSNPGSP